MAGFYNRCYCRTCGKGFYSGGIARHRAAHRDRAEDCVIVYSDGSVGTHEFSKKKKPPTQQESE